jgi:uncharacterized protein YdaU (DUF1376 family)
MPANYRPNNEDSQGPPAPSVVRTAQVGPWDLIPEVVPVEPKDFTPQVIDVDLPWCPIFTADFFGDHRVSELTATAQGQYLVLLLRSWETRGEGFKWTPNQALKWAFNRSTHRTLKRTLLGTFFVQVDGRWYNPRLEEIRRDQYRLYKARSAGGKAAAKAAAKARSAYAERHASQNSELRDDDDDDIAREEPNPTDPESKKLADPQVVAAGDLMLPPWNFGHARAFEVVERLGTTREDIAAWVEFERDNGTRLASMLLQRHRHPRDVPPRNDGKTPESFSERSKRKTMEDLMDLLEKRAAGTGGPLNAKS